MTTRRWDKSKPPRGPFTLNKDAPQAQGLAAWYPFGVAGGDFVADQSGRSHLSGANGGVVLGADGAPQMFFNGSSHVLNCTTTPVTAMPLTLAAWGRSNNASLVGTLISVDAGVSSPGSSNFYRLVVVGSASPKQVRANMGLASSEVQATYAAGWVAGNDFHTVGVFNSTTDRIVYYNGGNATSDATSLAAPTVSQVNVGRHSPSSALQYWSGSIGEAGIWNIGIGAQIVQRLYDPGTRFELWYPLRSRKWMVAGGGTDGNASGAPAALTLAAPTAMATGSALASGAPAGVTLTAPTGTASAAGNATATGAPAGLTLTAPTATASGSATASAAPAGSTLTAPTGTASSAGHALATGAPAGVTMTAPTATATGSAQAFAAFMATVLTAPTATASNGDVASVLGSLAGSARRIGPTRSNKQTATRSNRQTATR